jgi:glycosyltransferase involved in cell wall biosynthesis
MKKTKLLCILHYSPPAHGASKVGDFIKSSEKLQNEFDCKFIKIKSSDTIGDIGKVNFKKIYFVIELFLKILFTVLIFRPDKIYFTASIRGVAFYRDLLLSSIWKVYKLFKKCEVFYHYHTKGIKNFVKSERNRKLTKFFLKDINLVLLSPMLESDFEDVNTYKKVFYLPNGVEDNYDEKSFESYISKKDFSKLNILYLSNMIKSKGYFEVLKLANTYKDKNIQFYFAGGWQDKEDEKDFFKYIKENCLESNVTFHGFVNGKQKKELFEKSHIFLFPTRYKNEAFPLSILEAFSYGLPVLATDEGSIPFIIDERSGMVVNSLDNLDNLDVAFEKMIEEYINIDTSRYCRKRYLENFTLNKFEDNLVEIFR